MSIHTQVIDLLKSSEEGGYHICIASGGVTSTIQGKEFTVQHRKQLALQLLEDLENEGAVSCRATVDDLISELHEEM